MKSEAIPLPRSERLMTDLAELIKVRLTMLVLLTTLVGFLWGSTDEVHYGLLCAVMVGTGLSAAGAAALNQWMERVWDGLMKRTQNRPLPARRMRPTDALCLGLLFSVAGVVLLALLVNMAAALLVMLTLVSYLMIYTPMKRTTALNTLAGAVPGALPPLIGWVGARDAVELPGMVLFAILFLWQMPHFLAIAWMFREEYAAAGFCMLSRWDEDGSATARQAVIYSMALTLTSLLPSVIRMNTPVYFIGAFLLGALFTGAAVRFLIQRTRGAARFLFFVSIIYLPLLMGLLLVTRAR